MIMETIEIKIVVVRPLNKNFRLVNPSILLGDKINQLSSLLPQEVKSRIKDKKNKWLDWGAGPRASTHLILAAKAKALMSEKTTPDISDVKDILKPVLRHRIVPNFNAEAEGKTKETI